MELKELQRSATLVLIYAILLALVKVTSAETASGKDQALSQSLDQESVESVHFLYYPELNMYYDPKESLYIYSYEGRWRSQKNLPLEYREINLKELQYFLVEDFTADENTYLGVSGF